MPSTSNYSHMFPGILREGKPLNRAVTYFDDFICGGYVADAALTNESDPAAKFSEVANAGEWLVTRDAAPTIVIDDAKPNGVLKITTGSSANDFCSLQLNGEAFAVAANKRIIFETRIAINDIDDTQWYIGLASTDVTGSTLGPILDGTNDSIGFRQATDTGVDIYALCEDDTTETATDTGIDLSANDAFHVLRFEVDGTTKVKFFVDGYHKLTTTTNIPDAAAGLTPTIEVHSPTASSAISVDYVLCIADRQ